MKSHRYKLGLKEDGWRSLLSKRASDALLYQRGAAALCYSLLIASWELGAAYAAFTKFEVAFEKWLILCTNQNKR
jgi:hypothetical protein